MLLVALLVALAAACSNDGGPWFTARSVAEGSASLGVDEAVKVTATVRLREPLPSPSDPSAGSLVIHGSVTGLYADGLGLGASFVTRIVGVPDDPLYPDYGDPDASFLKCDDGTCEGDVVMIVFSPPFRSHPLDLDLTWPVELEWGLTARVGSGGRMGKPPVEIEVVSQEIVAGHAWEATTEVNIDPETALEWQALHYTIDLPPELMPRPTSEQDAWAWMSQAGPDYTNPLLDDYGIPLLDEGTVATWSGEKRDGIMCESVDGCDSLGYTWAFPPSTDVGSETVIGGATGLRIEGDTSSASASATATATLTAGADQAVRTTFSGIHNEFPAVYRVGFSISLVHPGHNDGWPVIVYIDERKRSGESDLTESTGQMVLTECRRTPCSGEFSLYPDHEAPFEWEVEVVVVPWSNEDTEGIEIEVAALP